MIRVFKLYSSKEKHVPLDNALSFFFILDCSFAGPTSSAPRYGRGWYKLVIIFCLFACLFVLVGLLAILFVLARTARERFPCE